MLKDFASSGSISINSSNCIRHTFSKTHCRECEDICPVDAIRFTPFPKVDTRICIECGLCYSSCKFSAIEMEKDDEYLIDATKQENPIDIGCLRAESNLKITCLSRLTEPLMLSWFLDKKEVVIKRGNCKKCRMKSSLTYFRNNLKKAVILSLSLGVLPNIKIRKAISKQIYIPKEKGLSRREIFTGLTKRFKAKQKTTKREILLGLLKAHDVIEKRPYPEIARIDIDERCNVCGVCEYICPTNAILIKKTDSGAEIHFSPAFCVNCKECERACIREAIHAHTATTKEFKAKPYTAFTARRIICEHCGKEFYSLTDESICSVCKNKEEGKQKFLDFLKNI